MEDKKILVARSDVPIRCRISANINELFGEVASEAETAMLDALGCRNIAQSLTEILRLDDVHMQQRKMKAKAAG